MLERCSIYIAEDLSIRSHEYLYLLYRPLMGVNACILYEVMTALAGKPIVPEDLQDFTSLTRKQLENARRQLEQYMLLTTFQSKDGKEHRYYLYAPLNPEAFLHHEIFSRLTVNNLSSGRYEKLCQLYTKENMPDENMENISEALQATELEDSWTQAKEIALQNHIPAPSELKRYPFDWELFFRGMDRSIPSRLRTKENMTRIAYLAHIYGLDERTMRKYVIRGIDSSRRAIDFDIVTGVLQSTSKAGTRKTKTGESSPAAFYADMLPEGFQVLPSESRLLIELSTAYHFSDEVIKEMVKYCIEQCQGVLNENYIRKVAASWSREKIDTRQKALEKIQKSRSYKSREAPMPEWYYAEDPGKPDEDLLARALALQKGLSEK